MARKKQYVNLALGTRGWTIVRTKLDGVEFKIRIDWIDGEDMWVLSLYTAAGVLMRGGLPLRHGVDVLEPFTGSDFPGGGEGKLMAWDFTRRQQDPGRNDLKTTSSVRLVYISIEEAA
jgi:hypothetical protein